ncbi:MAG: sulfite exporter TauE/SafE family protein [Anaerohalosphaeraceae bacterium]|nr:sulfite exporter TauE/SafE family protein [Anaerohalosphaeraceae bacterium]
MEILISTYIFAAIISVFVGTLTGIFGVGGGFLITPALMILLGVPGDIAVGTGLMMIVASSSLAMFKRRKSKTIDFKLGAALASGSTLGVFAGLYLMSFLKDMAPLTVFGREQNPVQYILLGLFFLLLVWIAGFMFFDVCRKKDPYQIHIGLFSVIKLPPYIRFDSLESPKMSLLPIVIFGCFAGVLTGLMGVGGGVIMLPALIFLVGQHPTKAAGTSLLIVWVSSIVGGTGHMLNGNFEIELLVCMLIGGLIGANVGTHIGLKLHGDKIKRYFVYIVAGAVMMVAYKVYMMTFID